MKQVNIVAPVNNLSYGIVSTRVNHFLRQNNVETSLFPIGNVEIAEEKYGQNTVLALNQRHLFYRAPCIRIYHQFCLDQFVGTKRIGWPIFELDTFTDQEKHHLSMCDELIVCSKWAKGIIEQNGITVPTHVVPLGVDSDIFFPLPTNHETCKFLNVGKIEVRKGHYLLIEAFNRAFEPDDDVELQMMWLNPVVEHVYGQQGVLEWCNLYKNSKMGHKVKFIHPQKTQMHVADVMRQVDCGVFPSFAEGWNLPALEMMACGKPLIISNYSAHTEFCNSQNSILLEPVGMEPAYDGFFFKEQGNWCILDLDDLANAMRDVYDMKKRGVNLNIDNKDVRQQFSWNNTAKLIEELL